MFARLNQFWFARIGVFVAVIWLLAVSLNAVFGRLTWDSFKQAAIVCCFLYFLLCIGGYVFVGLWRLTKFASYRESLKPDSIRAAAFQKWKMPKE